MRRAHLVGNRRVGILYAGLNRSFSGVLFCSPSSIFQSAERPEPKRARRKRESRTNALSALRLYASVVAGEASRREYRYRRARALESRTEVRIYRSRSEKRFIVGSRTALSRQTPESSGATVATGRDEAPVPGTRDHGFARLFYEAPTVLRRRPYGRGSGLSIVSIVEQVNARAGRRQVGGSGER